MSDNLVRLSSLRRGQLFFYNIKGDKCMCSLHPKKDNGYILYNPVGTRQYKELKLDPNTVVELKPVSKPNVSLGHYDEQLSLL